MEHIPTGPRGTALTPNNPQSTSEGEKITPIGPSKKSKPTRRSRRPSRKTSNRPQVNLPARAPLGTPHHHLRGTSSEDTEEMRPFARHPPMKRVDSGNGRMLANEARAAELKAARARGAREDAARKEDSRTDNLPEDGEEDEVPEPGPTSLEQYIRPGTKPRTNQSNTPHAHVEGTRRSSMSTEAIRNVESDFGFSDSETDRVPASSQASYSHLSAGTDRFSGYKSHVTLRPSFSRTAQGYDVTEPTTALPQPMTFNPQETQYMYPRNNGPFTEYRNEMSRESCTPIHAAETVRGNQPPIRVTLPNNQRRDSHQLEQTTISSTKQDPKHFSNIHADEYEKLRQQLYSLSEVETLKSSRDSVGTATYDPVPRGSNVGLRSSVQTVIHRPLPGELHKSGDIPGATLQNRVIHDTDPKPSWRERHGDLFKESATFPRLGDSILNATTPEGAIGMAGSKMRNNTFAQPTKVAADAPAAAKLSNVDEWWYHEYKKRQNLHDHYANVANAASYHQVPQGPGQTKQPTEFQHLMAAAFTQLSSYVTSGNNPRVFGQYTGQVAEWCIDKGPGGNVSFFDDTWGAPPSRVGRDPRYRPTFHEGRYTVFDEGDRHGARL